MSPAVLAAMLLVVAASWFVTRRESDMLTRSSSRDSTLKVLQATQHGTAQQTHPTAATENNSTAQLPGCGQRDVVMRVTPRCKAA